MRYYKKVEKYNFAMQSTQSIVMLRPGTHGGLVLRGRPTLLDMEWYKPGALIPECVTVKDLYIKIQSRSIFARNDLPIVVSYYLIKIEFSCTFRKFQFFITHTFAKESILDYAVIIYFFELFLTKIDSVF